MSTTPTPIHVPGITTEASPYPSAMRVGHTLYVSGQVSFTDDGAVAHEGEPRAQVRRTLERLEMVLTHCGLGRDSVVQATVYLTDPSYGAALNEEWIQWFGEHRPARATVITELLDPRLLVEVTATATIGDAVTA